VSTRRRGGRLKDSPVPDGIIPAVALGCPISALEIVPSLEDGRPPLQSAVDNTVYYRDGVFTLLSLKAAYDPTFKFTFEHRATNLTGRHDELEDHTHAAGQEFFATIRFGL